MGMLMKPGNELTAIHPAVEAGVNNQDIDGLMALYAEDASMILVDGSIVTGLPAIRDEWSGILAMNGHITVRSRFAIAAGDLAVLSNEWTFEVGGEQISSVTAEVARRQPDGGWLYVIDHPYAGSEPDELATIMAATETPSLETEVAFGATWRVPLSAGGPLLGTLELVQAEHGKLTGDHPRQRMQSVRYPFLIGHDRDSLEGRMMPEQLA